MDALLELRRTLDKPAAELVREAEDEARRRRKLAVLKLRREVRRLHRASRPMPAGNVNRLWLQCPKCGRLQHREYVPYSLSNPILTTACGHGRYEDLVEVVTVEQRAGSERRTWSWREK